MKILVTGATGFLGGEIARALMARGDDVTATGRSARKGAELAQSGMSYVAADLSVSAEASALKIHGFFDAIIHCAALSSPWGRYELFERANIDATKNMLELARVTHCQKFVYISSPSIYFAFKDQLGVGEDMPLPAPVNHYAKTKALAEQHVRAANDINSVILRPRALYGRGDTSVLPRLIRALERGKLPLLRGGQAVTNFTHVSDVARAALLAVDTDVPNGRAYNIAGSEDVNVKSMAEKIAAHMDIDFRWKKLPLPVALGAIRSLEALHKLRAGQPEPIVTAYSLGLFAYSQTLSIERAKKELGWSPQIDIDTGLDMTLAAGGAS